MQVFITSSPFVENAEGPILWEKNQFLARLRDALPPFPRCLYICSDPDTHDLNCRWGADIFKAFANAEIFFSHYEVLDGSNADFAPEMVAQADFIVTAGGHVPTQNAFFQDIQLRELLEGWDGVVMGISAGSMNLAEAVYVQPEEEGESDPHFPRWAPGLNLTDVNILPHYQKVKNNILDGLRLFEDITYADSQDNEFFALVDGSYFYQDEEHLLLFGEGYRLSNGILEQLTRDGDILDLAQLGA